jgi:hypothetical protein
VKSSIFSTVFSVVFAVSYLMAVERNYALFTYHPALGEFGWGVQPVKDGPAMYWYGWLATCGIVATVSGMIASLFPHRIMERLTPAVGWAIPLGVLVAFAWLLRGYFLG